MGYQQKRCLRAAPIEPDAPWLPIHACTLYAAMMASLSGAEVDQLFAHCRSKVGVEEHPAYRGDFKFSVLSGSLDFFARFYLNDEPRYVLLRCDNIRRAQMEAAGVSVRVSDRMRWAGPDWKWTNVDLDGSVPFDEFISLIHRSYDFAVARLKDKQKEMLSLLARQLPAQELLAEMIVGYGLQDRKADIEGLLQPAIRLTTSRTDETQLPIGGSRIGGHPDLPPSLSWPRFRDGRSLSFLAEINLAEVPASQRPPELPPTGILCFLSLRLAVRGDA